MKKEATIFVKEGLVLLKQSEVIKLEEVSDCLIEKFKKELEEQGYEVETIRNKEEK